MENTVIFERNHLRLLQKRKFFPVEKSSLVPCSQTLLVKSAQLPPHLSIFRTGFHILPGNFDDRRRIVRAIDHKSMQCRKFQIAAEAMILSPASTEKSIQHPVPEFHSAGVVLDDTIISDPIDRFPETPLHGSILSINDDSQIVSLFRRMRRIETDRNRQKEKGKRGKLLYINALLNLFFRYKSVPMTVFCDGMKVFDGKCFSVALGNGRFCGGGLRQTPGAVFDDGLLDLTVIPESALPHVLAHVARLFDGRFASVKGLVCGRGRSVIVVPGTSRREIIEVDGEIIGNTPVRFEVLPEQMNVLHRF